MCAKSVRPYRVCPDGGSGHFAALLGPGHLPADRLLLAVRLRPVGLRRNSGELRSDPRELRRNARKLRRANVGLCVVVAVRMRLVSV